MANVKISDLAPAQLPLDLPNTLFEVQTIEAGIPVSRKLAASDLTVTATITIEDEGTPLATGADTLNFVGAGVTASGTGSTKTITIPGAGAQTLQAAYDGGNTILIDGVPNAVTLNASVSGEMFEAFDTSANLIFQILDVGVIAGNPGNEGAGILINGVLEDSVFKASDIGSANRPQVILHRHSSTDPSVLVTARAQGNGVGHTILSANDPIFLLQNTGWDGASYAIASEIEFRVDGTPALDDMPGLIAFSTTPSGAEVSTERVRIREFGLTEFDVAIDFLERNAAVTGPTAGRAQLWVRDDSPNVLIFTDDTGSDFVLNAGVSGPAGANTEIQYNNSGSFGADAEFTWNSVQGQLRLTHDQPGGSGRDCFIIDVERPSASAIVVTTNEVGPGNVILEMEADTGAADGFRLETSWFGAQADHFMRFVNGGGVDQLVLRFDGLAQMGGVTFDQPNTTIELGGQILEFTERASANPSAATIGQLWVRNDSPNVLVFTDDTGTDTVLGSGGGATPGGVNTDIQFNNAGAFGGSTDLQWTGTALELGGSLFDFVPTALLTNARMQMRNAAGGVSFDQNASTGVLEISQTDPFGVDQDLWITLNRNADVKLFHNNVEVARTDSLANGGFEVNNTVTGAGFERVLTTSDLGGGGGVNSVTAGTNLNDTGTAADPILNVDDPLIIGSINATSALQSNTTGSPYLNVPLNIGANLIGTQGMTQYTRQFIQARPSSFGYNSTLFINIQGEPGTNGANTFIGGLNSAGIEVDFGVEVNLRHGVAPGSAAPVMSTFTRGIKLPQGSIYVTQTASPGANDTNSGQFWVRNDTVQKPMFTDDAGRDHNLIAEFDEQTSDSTVNNSIVLVNSQIQFSNIPTGHYRIDMLVLLRDVAVTGCGARVQISLSGADPDSVMRVVNKNFSGAGTPSYDEVGLVGDLFDAMPLVTGSGTSRFMFSGIVEFISGTNSFDVQFAQNTQQVGDLDFESGSWCSLTRVGP